jgi:glycosyltransferase involved in cell wall biosynthesis
VGDVAPPATPPGRPPVFSVVTVTLDPGAALKDTARSVAEQTFGGYEHLVKDGGSKDGSLAALAGSSRARLVVRPDSGIYDAMNQALDEARGEYVLFLNAGDRLNGPDVLERVARAAAEDRSVDLFYCDYVNAEMGGEVVSPDRLTRFLLYRSPICHQAWFLRRAVYDRVGRFDTSFRLAADHDLLARAVLRGGIRSRHLAFPGVVYQGAGYSRSPANRARLKEEIAMLRARSFDPATRRLYAVLWHATLPSLRTRLNTSPALRFLWRPYTAVVNAIYRAAASRGSS